MGKRLLATAVCAVAGATLSAGPAFAGEITGTGQPTAGPAHAKSECVFSGLNDNPNEAFPFGGTAQSFGRLVAQLGPMGGIPGFACNPTRSFEEE